MDFINFIISSDYHSKSINLEEENEQLKKRNYQLECTLREILKYCNYLHNNCKYTLNDGHIRKIRSICRRELNSEEEND